MSELTRAPLPSDSFDKTSFVFVFYDGYSSKYKCVAQSGMDVKQNIVTMDGTGGH